MKAHIRRIDASILFTHARPSRIQHMLVLAGGITCKDVQSLASSDTEARIARIKLLKMQVNAGTYVVDCRDIAQKMLASSDILILYEK